MATRGQTRPATDAAAKIIKGGNTLANARAMQAWIGEQELTRSQILSISANETDIEEGDNVLTLFYRKQSIVSGDAPLVNLQFDSFNNQQSWDKQLKGLAALKAQRPVNMIAVSRTPKNVGNARCQTAWFTSELGAASDSTLIHRGDGNWDALAQQVNEWLGRFIAPHQLRSVSMYEDAHPNATGQVAAVVTHTAGPNPV